MRHWESVLRPSEQCVWRGVCSKCSRVSPPAHAYSGFSSVAAHRVHPSGRAVPSSREMEPFCKVGLLERPLPPTGTGPLCWQQPGEPYPLQERALFGEV